MAGLEQKIKKNICKNITLLIGMGLIFIYTLPLTTCIEYEDMLKMFHLQEAYQIPNRSRVVDLEKLKDCKCPRVYWPACATDSITYVNGCILNCLNKTLMRLGPCITFRRNGGKTIHIYIPNSWKRK